LIRNASRWWPYLRSLPDRTDLNVPLVYSETELDELRGSEVLEYVMEYRRGVVEKYRVVRERVFDVYPDTFPIDTYSLDTYLWGTVMIESRSIRWNDQHHLVPLMDLANCATTSRSSESESSQRRRRRDVVEEDGLVRFRTHRAFEPGEMLDETCDMANWESFLYHGFVTTNGANPYDCVRVRLALREDDAKYAAKQRELQRRGIFTTSLQTCLTPRRSVPSDVWTFVRILYGIADTDALNARRALVGRLREHLSRYPTSMDSDEEILNGDAVSLTRRHRIIVQLRIEEKRLLIGMINMLNEWIERHGGGGGGEDFDRRGQDDDDDDNDDDERDHGEL